MNKNNFITTSLILLLTLNGFFGMDTKTNPFTNIRYRNSSFDLSENFSNSAVSTQGSTGSLTKIETSTNLKEQSIDCIKFCYSPMHILKTVCEKHQKETQACKSMSKKKACGMIFFLIEKNKSMCLLGAFDVHALVNINSQSKQQLKTKACTVKNKSM